MNNINVWLNKPILNNIQREVSCIIEYDGRDRSTLWYRLPLADETIQASCADPFAIATVFLAMERGRPLVIHGRVSPCLLANLEEFAAIWARWKPNRYQAITISAEVEEESPRCESDEAIVAFSGGVDACYTVYRHVQGLAGRQNKKVAGGLMVHGFDIPLEDKRGFDAALGKNQRMLKSLGIALVPIQTNWRQLGIDWEDGHGAALGASLSLLAGRFRYGLISSGEPYELLPIPWGSSPLTDHLFSSSAFSVVHDGASASRTEKVAVISEWAEACRDLRVCWEGEQHDGNCGCCEKCVRTALNFRAATGSCPACLGREVSNEMIANLPIRNRPQYNELISIVAYAEKTGHGNEDWVKALRNRLHHYRKTQERTSSFQQLRARVALRTRLRRLANALL